MLLTFTSNNVQNFHVIGTYLLSSKVTFLGPNQLTRSNSQLEHNFTTQPQFLDQKSARNLFSFWSHTSCLRRTYWYAWKHIDWWWPTQPHLEMVTLSWKQCFSLSFTRIRKFTIWANSEQVSSKSPKINRPKKWLNMIRTQLQIGTNDPQIAMPPAFDMLHTRDYIKIGHNTERPRETNRTNSEKLAHVCRD